MARPASPVTPPGAPGSSDSSGASGSCGSCGACGPGSTGGPSGPGHVGRLSAQSRLGAALEEFWIALFAWVPTPLGLALRLLAWRWLFAACGSVRFGTGLTLAGCRNMRLGRGVRLGRGCFVTAGGGSLTLGENVAVSPCAHLGADNGSIEIGAQTAIGPGTVIRAANHRFRRQDLPIMRQGHQPGQVIIEDDVWIGANCVITPDVRIGRGAVVGAGAVVTRNVAPFSIVAGVPAKVIGRRG